MKTFYVLSMICLQCYRKIKQISKYKSNTIGGMSECYQIETMS